MLAFETYKPEQFAWIIVLHKKTLQIITKSIEI
jgi:hypothetical protein